jgi:hypothetical protein
MKYLKDPAIWIIIGVTFVSIIIVYFAAQIGKGNISWIM